MQFAINIVQFIPKHCNHLSLILYQNNCEPCISNTLPKQLLTMYLKYSTKAFTQQPPFSNTCQYHSVHTQCIQQHVMDKYLLILYHSFPLVNEVHPWHTPIILHGNLCLLITHHVWYYLHYNLLGTFRVLLN